MDATDLKFDNNSFDTVVGTFALSSTDRPDQMLKEMVRVCRPEGKILILDRGQSFNTLMRIHLDLYRYEYIYKYGYD